MNDQKQYNTINMELFIGCTKKRLESGMGPITSCESADKAKHLSGCGINSDNVKQDR